MTIYVDNPAGRLHRWLGAFNAKCGQHCCLEAWAAAMRVRSSDTSALMRRLATISRLPHDIDVELGKISEEEYDRDLALRWRAKVEPVLAAVFTDKPSVEVARDLDQPWMLSLESCSFLLHKHRPEPVLRSDQLEHLRETVDRFEEEIHDTPDVDPELRDLILFHCGAISSALHDLPLRGHAAVTDAVDRAYGAAFRRGMLAGRNGAGRGSWEKFRDLVVTAAAIIQIPAAGVVLPAEIKQAIGQPLSVTIVHERPRPAIPAARETGDRDGTSKEGATPH